MKYCDICKKETETKIINKKEIYEVYGEQIEVETQVLVCCDCAEELFCEQLDNETLIKAFNTYRKKHKLLLPEEIKAIREQYGLSQRSFAKLLNWGDKTINRYENGSIQDKAHNSLLLFLKNPENMRTYLAENEVMLEDRQVNKIIKTIDKLEGDIVEKEKSNLLKLYFSYIPCEDNGYKGFDYEKFCLMVLYFAQKSPELLKTKLMKLLNYSDMLFYKENGISISGLKYIHLPFGPVPENYDVLFGIMSADHIAHIEVVYDNGYEKHQIVSDCDFIDSYLSSEELEVLERVYEKFRTYGSKDISIYSHKEKGYCSTKPGEVISYSFAKDICL